MKCDVHYEIRESPGIEYFSCQNPAVHFYVRVLKTGNEYAQRCEEHPVHFHPPGVEKVLLKEYLAYKAVDYVMKQ